MQNKKKQSKILKALKKIGSYTNIIKQIGGNFNPQLQFKNNENIQQLLQFIFKDINANQIVDMHCHVITERNVNGEQGYINPIYKNFSIKHLFTYCKSQIMQSAAGVNINNQKQFDLQDQFINRLLFLLKNFKNQQQEISLNQQINLGHPKALLLAFDEVYDISGKKRPDLTTFYTPNECIFDIYQNHQEFFYMAASIHPYRDDAIEQIEKWAQKGIKIIKLLPNSMNIDLVLNDPNSNQLHPKLKKYFQKVKECGMTLLIHVGEEHSADIFINNELGNPLKLKGPLDEGVRVIAAHGNSYQLFLNILQKVASEGICKDFNNNNQKKPAIELLFRLMSNPKYDTLLFTDISAITIFKRVEVIPQILMAENLQHRMVYGNLFQGSDYPLPGVNILIQLDKLNHLIPEEISIGNNTYLKKNNIKECLKIIYKYNPLLFDFSVKRLLTFFDNNKAYQLDIKIFQADLFQKNNKFSFFQ